MPRCLQAQMDGKPVSDHILELSAAIGENISLGEVRCLTAPSVLGRYLHTVVSDGLGRIGVMVALQCPQAFRRTDSCGKTDCHAHRRHESTGAHQR